MTQPARRSALLAWSILGVWLLSSLAGLLYLEYQAALSGILCMVAAG